MDDSAEEASWLIPTLAIRLLGNERFVGVEASVVDFLALGVQRPLRRHNSRHPRRVPGRSSSRGQRVPNCDVFLHASEWTARPGPARGLLGHGHQRRQGKSVTPPFWPLEGLNCVWKGRLEETVAGLVRLGEFASSARPTVGEAHG